jgi:hypothetical protein
MPGGARPAQDPYASSTKAKGVNDIAKEIEAALADMAPDLGDAERRLMAADLARQYRQQRGEAVRGMTRAPMAPPTEQMEFDQAYSEMQSAGRTEDRIKARLERELREERVSEMKQNQLEQRRVNARQRSVEAAAGRPQWQMEGRRPEARGNAPAGAATGPRPGMPGVGPPAGNAQPIAPPSQGSAYGGRDKQAMYWELVDGGMSPAEARKQVRSAFHWAPR